MKQTIADIGEFGLIERVSRILRRDDEHIWVGLGEDDAAVVAPSPDPTVYTTDAMVDEVHFRRDWADAGSVAWKALASAISDLAGKAARPQSGLITMGLPGELSVEWVETFYRELARLQDEWQFTLCGGDTVRSPVIWVSISVWGAQTTASPLLINGARPGDEIMVTGAPGDAVAGLKLLLDGDDEPSFDYLRQRFHRPSPRIAEALAIVSLVTPSAMTDISDGLSRDLPKLCRASGVGAEIDAALLPCSTELKRYGNERASALAWEGGEDYELLFTVSSADAKSLLKKWTNDKCPITRIGTIVSGDEIRIDGIDPGVSGFDHFRA